MAHVSKSFEIFILGDYENQICLDISLIKLSEIDQTKFVFSKIWYYNYRVNGFVVCSFLTTEVLYGKILDNKPLYTFSFSKIY